MTPAQALLHLRQVLDTAEDYEEVSRQAVRDAHRAGSSVTDIASIMGTSNRNRIYEVLRAPAEPVEMSPAPVVFLRGAGVAGSIWAEVVAAMHSRGWWTVRDRTQAWHLARARVPVVLLDISVDQPTAGLVKARMNGDHMELPLVGEWTVAVDRNPESLALAVIDQLHPQLIPSFPAPPVSLDPATITRAFVDGPVTARSISVPDPLWARARSEVAAGGADSLQTLIAVALAEKVAGIELAHNAGQPFPVPPTGTRGTRAGAPTKPDGSVRKLRLPESMWDQARAVVAAGVAGHSISALICQALADKLPTEQDADQS